MCITRCRRCLRKCAVNGEIKWFVHADSGKSINFLQRDIFTTAWDSEMQYGEAFEETKTIFMRKIRRERETISSIWTLIAINVKRDSKNKFEELFNAKPDTSWNAPHESYALWQLKTHQGVCRKVVKRSISRRRTLENIFAAWRAFKDSHRSNRIGSRRHQQFRPTINYQTMGQLKRN